LPYYGKKVLYRNYHYGFYNMKYRKLTVVKRLPESKYLCRCDCGNERIVAVGHFNAGYFKSCGCDHWHGHAKNRSREYISFHNMIARCHKKSNKRYKDYGLKGITVCKRWKNSFINFIVDMGKCPDEFTLDRIDSRKGYSPDNCHWVSRSQNQRNRLTSKKWIVDGKEYSTLEEAALEKSVSSATILAWCKGRKASGHWYPQKQNCDVRNVY